MTLSGLVAFARFNLLLCRAAPAADAGPPIDYNQHRSRLEMFSAFVFRN
jgi:hypothetical protein